MYYSYVLGIDDTIMELKRHGFAIEHDGDNFMIAFPAEKRTVWEDFIRKHLESIKTLLLGNHYYQKILS